jgi:hypothetical protein
VRTLLWTPAAGDPLEIKSQAEPHVLVKLAGESNTLAAPVGTASPRQIGLTPLGVVVGGRTLELEVGIVGATEAAREEALALLIAAWTATPPRIGERPDLGTVTYTKPGQEPLTIEAIPAGGPTEAFMDDTREMAVYECSLWCPDPRWRFATGEVAIDVTVIFGGFTFPLSFPTYFEVMTIGGEVVNPGNTSSALRIRFHGEFTGAARVINDTTGEQIEVTGGLSADQFIEVSTEFGAKYVTLHDADGTTSNALDRYNLTTSTFFQLPQGTSFLRFEADDNATGYAEVFYTPALSGA